MKRFSLTSAALMLTLMVMLTLAPRALAQFGDTMHGQVIGFDGKPMAGVTVLIQNESAQKWTTTTDKNGKWEILHLPAGIYSIELKNGDQHLWGFKYQLIADKDDSADANLKEIAAKQGVNQAEQQKKQEELKQQFQGMKQHFDAGVAAMNQAGALRVQLQTTPPDQRGPIQEQLSALFKTATTEFQAAQDAAKENDPNLPVIVSNLGAAYEGAGQYDKAVEAFQKAITLKPNQANFYSALGTDLAYLDKVPEAGAACDKAGALDPPSAATCWRNIGIVLRNRNKMKEATEPLKKATELDPKNADGWYLLATSLLASIETKQVGDKLTYDIPPGTAEAYQKCVDLAPNGPHAQECKDGLTSLQALGQGVETKVSTKKKK